MSADGSSPISLPLAGKTIRAADLFCGAGGTSTGARRAIHQLGGKLKLVAINHWQTAIDTHSRMHPEATHLCADLEHVRPRQAVPGGVLDLLMASPTCTYHSRARGGRPVHDQQRMDPWHVVRWLSDIRVHRILVENVPEMVDWGPCDVRTGRPIKSRKGEYFRAWLQALESIGFKVDWRVLTCADYGDATTRQRFFLIGRSDRKPLRWPEPSHVEGGAQDHTKANLGLARPIIVPSFGEAPGQKPRFHSIDEPAPAITATGHQQLASPVLFRVNQGDGRLRNLHSLNEPMPTATCSESLGIGFPAVVGYSIDVLYRMLHWRELARGMSFDDEGEVYQFAGTSTEITKQIGNAVPGRTAKALVRALLEPA